MALGPAPDTSPAVPIVDGLRGFGESVLSIVPAGFEAYVRVFHPAVRRDGTAVPWSDIAAATGKQAHAGMQLNALTGIDPRADDQAVAGVFDMPPAVGDLPPAVAAPLVKALAAHTSSPDRCWLAVWEGIGFLDLRPELREGPLFDAPNRRYHLLVGEVVDVVATAHAWPSITPNLWWPDDRAWCVGTEIDFDTTYVGCSDACRSALLGADLEALAIDPATGVDWGSDRLNAV